MIKFFKRYLSSMKFINRVADEIGVERKVFQAALNQMNANFSIYEMSFTEQDTELNEDIRLKRICMMIIPEARLGAAQLRMRFGDQPKLEQLVFKMIEYQEKNLELVDNPDEYRRNAMHH